MRKKTVEGVTKICVSPVVAIWIFDSSYTISTFINAEKNVLREPRFFIDYDKK